MALSTHARDVLQHTTTPDVLVIGGGIAGLCAAITARRAGADVRLIEHAARPVRGGNARHARNLRAAHREPTRFSPGNYAAAEFVSELGRIGGQRSDPALSLILAEDSASVVSWLAATGVPFQPAGTGLLPVSRRTSFLLGGGKTMINRLYETAGSLGVTIDYGTRCTALTLVDARLVAVDVETPGGAECLRPRAVTLCCGSAQADRAALRATWGDACDAFINRGSPYADGALLRTLIAQGVATVGEPGACHLVAVDARSPPADGGIATRVLGILHGIVVGLDGRRFHDEGGDAGPTRYAVWGRKIAEQPRQLAWLILDAMAMRQVPRPLFQPISAGSLPDLAVLADLDPQTVTATVRDFNAAIRCGGKTGHTVGLDPPKTRYAQPLSEPPFAAIPIRPGITFTCQGVRVDGQAQVMTTGGAPIENLFAAGMIMAGNVLGHGYLAGAGLTIGVVFGRRAGAAAARCALAARGADADVTGG